MFNGLFPKFILLVLFLFSSFTFILPLILALLSLLRLLRFLRFVGKYRGSSSIYTVFSGFWPVFLLEFTVFSGFWPVFLLEFTVFSGILASSPSGIYSFLSSGLASFPSVVCTVFSAVFSQFSFWGLQFSLQRFLQFSFWGQRLNCISFKKAISSSPLSSRTPWTLLGPTLNFACSRRLSSFKRNSWSYTISNSTISFYLSIGLLNSQLRPRG